MKGASARGLRHVDLFIDPAAAPLPFPWNYYHFPLAIFELIPRAGRPHASAMDCFVLSSSALVRDSPAEGEMGVKLQMKGVHRPELQNTNHCTCQGCSGKVWHLALFWYQYLATSKPPLSRSPEVGLPISNPSKITFSIHILPPWNYFFGLFLPLPLLLFRLFQLICQVGAVRADQ